MSAASPPLRAYVLAFATIYLVWGSTYLAMRVGVETMPPFAMAGLRFLTAGSLFLGFLRLRGHLWPTPRQWCDAYVSGFFLLLGGNGLVTWAEQTIPSSIAALLIGSGPAFIVLTEWAWPGGRRPSPLTFGAMLLGFGGVAWLAAPWENTGHGRLDSAGVAAILAACFSWGIGTIYSRHARDPAPPFTAAAAQMLAGGVLLALAAAFHGDFAAWDFAAISGYTAFVWLVKHSTPALTATYAYVNPVVSVFLGWLLLDEPVTPRTLAASAVIIGAVAIITLHRNRRI